jgi:hypothetical protein
MAPMITTKNTSAAFIGKIKVPMAISNPPGTQILLTSWCVLRQLSFQCPRRAEANKIIGFNAVHIVAEYRKE